MKKLKKDLETILKALNGLSQKVKKLQEQIVEGVIVKCCVWH